MTKNKRNVPLHMTSRLTSGLCGGIGLLSVSLSSMMSRLNRAPLMYLSSESSSNSNNGDRASGSLKRFLGVKMINGFLNWRWIWRRRTWK